VVVRSGRRVRDRTQSWSFRLRCAFWID